MKDLFLTAMFLFNSGAVVKLKLKPELVVGFFEFLCCAKMNGGSCTTNPKLFSDYFAQEQIVKFAPKSNNVEKSAKKSILFEYLDFGILTMFDVSNYQSIINCFSKTERDVCEGGSGSHFRHRQRTTQAPHI